MGKQTALLFLVFSSVFGFAFSSKDAVQEEFSATATPTPTLTPNISNESFAIETDRNTFSDSCPPGSRCSGNCNNNPLAVSVISSKKSENDSFRYDYKVSGGRISGDGAKVRWNLNGAQPGTYEIKVDITDRKSGNLLQSATKTIAFEICRDESDRCLACPQFSIDAPTSPTEAGATMIFTANVKYGGNGEAITYNWTISSGKIIEGQGTPIIKVATNSKMAGKIVKATVNFKWNCSDICLDNSVSSSGLVATKKRGKKQF